MDFVTLDFETATPERDSPCEIGITTVENGVVSDTYSWLIKPKYKEFNYFNILINGIKPEDVINAPEFNVLWKDVSPLLDGKYVIAHNASFDLSVLRATLNTYQLPYPKLSYCCSYIISKITWSNLPSYDLKTLCKVIDIELSHHRAGSDSKATAELCLKAFAAYGINSIEDISEKLNIIIGELYEGGYNPCKKKRDYSSRVQQVISGDPSKFNPDSIFYGKKVVFTGALSSMTRADAQKLIADSGGILANSITSDTNFLIVGFQDYRVVGENGLSSKQEKALKLIEKGNKLEILCETDFIKNL